MKKRIRIDSAILSSFILLTGFLYIFPTLYPQNFVLNGILYFLGQLFILKGAFLRMAARGHKKAFSKNGAGLVTTGPYMYVRNPMYLGTFLLGCGFILIVWPWWALPVFVILFYLRFNRQIVIEEKHLGQLFGKSFEDYCQRVPRLFPNPSLWNTIDIRKAFVWEEVWSTKERRIIVVCPLAAGIMELIKEKYVFHMIFVEQVVWLAVLAAGVYAFGLWYKYRNAEG